MSVAAVPIINYGIATISMSHNIFQPEVDRTDIVILMSPSTGSSISIGFFIFCLLREDMTHDMKPEGNEGKMSLPKWVTGTPSR